MCNGKVKVKANVSYDTKQHPIPRTALSTLHFIYLLKRIVCGLFILKHPATL